MRAGTQFASATRRGRRASSPELVVHALRVDDTQPTQVGFVVSRQVGNAVTRHRVTRVLRHAMAPTVMSAPVGWWLVVRALPASGRCSAARLRAALHSCLTSLGLAADAAAATPLAGRAG